MATVTSEVVGIGSSKRAEALLTKIGVTGWKASVGSRVLRGCGNCPDRYICAETILRQGGVDKPLQVAERILLNPQRYAMEPHEIASTIGAFAQQYCAKCDAIVICSANLMAFNRGHNVLFANEHKRADTIALHLGRADVANRIQAIFDACHMTDRGLKRAAIVQFARCRCGLRRS